MIGYFFKLSVGDNIPLLAISKTEGSVKALWSRFFERFSTAEVVERKHNMIVFDDFGCRRMIDYGSYTYDGEDPYKAHALVTL